MKKLNQILQFIVLVYFGIFLFFLMGFDTLGPIFGIKETTPQIMTSIMLIGGALLVIHWGTSILVIKGIKNILIQKEQEMISLKAKLYDLEHPKLKDKKFTDPEKESAKSEGPNLTSEK